MVPIVIIGFVYFLSLCYFGYQYVIILPYQYASWWHYGYTELFEYLLSKESKAGSIAISGKASVPYIFLLYNRRVNPQSIATQIHRNFILDEFGFEHVDSFGKYQFPRNFSWNKDGVKLGTGSYLVTTPQEEVESDVQLEYTIKYPNGTPAYFIYEIL